MWMTPHTLRFMDAEASIMGYNHVLLVKIGLGRELVYHHQTNLLLKGVNLKKPLYSSTNGNLGHLWMNDAFCSQYPLVNVYIAMEHHHFEWVTHL